MQRITIWLVLIVAVSTGATAQEIRRFELGAHTTMLRTSSDVRECLGCSVPQWAIGPALTVNLNRTLAVDGSVSWFPHHSSSATDLLGGNLTQALTGVKTSIRHGRWIMFAKARPGLVSWSRTITGVKLTPGADLPFAFDFGPKTHFAVDFGAGIEASVSRRVSARFEMGDTRIYLGRLGTSDNLQITTGVYYGVGQVIGREVPRVDAKAHTFVDKINLAIWTASLLAQTADAVTTQRFRANCLRSPPFGDLSLCKDAEADPLARPFVRHGWGGQIGLAVIVNGVQVSTQYVLHRWGRHRVERLLTVPLMIGNTACAYSNLQ